MRNTKFDQAYNISMAFITDKNTDTDNISQNFFRLRQVIFGKTYTLTISAPKDSEDYIIKNSVPSTSTRFTHAKKHGPLGEICLYREKDLLLHYRSKYPVAPVSTTQDNIFQKEIRKFCNRNFFKLTEMAQMRNQGKVVLRDNTKQIYELIHEISQQKTK
ncbi:MAG: hypothetical protein J6R52_01865 [Alphaproteobacteria bacterium]|nr:hypothetical protein [Alphaproteobacteria bacterium]